MANERGTFPLYDPKLETNNPFINRLKEADPELASLMKKYGRRNIALLTIAPAGSVSILTRTTSGIECAFMVAYKRRRKVNPNDKNVTVAYVDDNGDSWEEYMVYHPHFKTWMLYNGIDPEKVSSMTSQELDAVIAQSPYYKAMSNDVDWVEKVKMQGAMQKWIDHSISVTVNLPNDVTEELVNDVYVAAWRAGCKGCTIYRDGSRSGVLISADKKEETLAPAGDNHAPKRPKFLDCDVIRFMNKGEKWIGFVGLYDGRPYEMFTGRADAMKVPHSVEVGRIRKTKVDPTPGDDKTKVSKYDFLYIDHTGTEIECEWLNKAFNKEYWNYAKLVSGLLRHKMPLPNVVDLITSLNLDDDVISTWKNGVVRMIKRYIIDGTTTDKTCQNCGSDSVVYQEGCLKCTSCGSSKCG
jgi:ribonucleoside-diphosphate reductase alpha chain